MRAAGLAMIWVTALFAASQPRSDDKLPYPAGYREWTFLSSGLGMSYASSTASSSEPEFDNVFANPEAYRAFLASGTWPVGTTLVLEVRSGKSHSSINRAGHFQEGLTALEVEVKDGRNGRAWNFYGFGTSTGPGTHLPAAAACYGCHAQNGAVDNTFVQFYPTLRTVALRRGTFHDSAETDVK